MKTQQLTESIDSSWIYHMYLCTYRGKILFVGILISLIYEYISYEYKKDLAFVRGAR